MASSEQRKKLLKARIAVALRDELGRVPTQEEIEQVFLCYMESNLCNESNPPMRMPRISILWTPVSEPSK